MNEPYTETVPIADIVIPKGRRRIDEKNVQAIAESIAAGALIQPIGLTTAYKLIYGLHRIEAQKRLKHKTIEARIYDVTPDEAELLEIDENLCRHALDALDYSKALARRKELYLKLHPQTAQGTAGAVAKHGSEKAASADSALAESQQTKSFAKDTADKTGKAVRTVQEAVAIGKAIPDDVAKTLEGSGIADNKSQLKQLAALPEAEQRKAAKKIASGKAETVAEAIAEPSKVLDSLGREVPKGMEDVFRRASQFDDALNACTSLKKAMNAIKDDSLIGVAFSSKAVASAALRDLENVRHALKFAKPYAVCPYCKGKGCEPCLEAGWATKSVYEAAPKELK